jgi:macrodomain Ter protein organizer (MatP/YcbG family)
MLAILLKLRVKNQMKIQNEKIVINQYINNHFSNVLHRRFKSLSVIRDVLIIDKNDVLKLD